MTNIEPRFLVLERWMGRTIPSIEYGDFPRTRRLIKEKRAARIPITPLQALFGPVKLMEMAKERG